MFTENPVFSARYVARSLLGVGASGRVWRCRDRLGEEDVAVKVIDVNGTSLISTRRELVALRALELPGAVRLLDSGLWRGPEGVVCPFLVMELVEGAPFSMAHQPWDTLRPRAIALLHSLRLLHGARVVHRDLKPEHIRVCDDGRVILLDLGLATGIGAGVRKASFRAEAGTPAFMAPEQFLDAERADHRADLYAVGLMLYTALMGTPPHTGPDRASYKRQRLGPPPPALASVAPTVPAHVAETIDVLLCRHARDRPASVDEVLTRLGASSSVEIHRALHRLSDQPLSALFVGPEPIFHLPSDAAETLTRRAGPSREAQVTELGAWLASGVARWKGERLMLSRAHLRALNAGSSVGGSVAETESLEALLARWSAEAHTAWLRGDLDRALWSVDQALEAARVMGDGVAERAMLVERVRISVGLDLGALRRTRYELDRAECGPVDDLGALIDAAIGARGDQADREGSSLEALPPLEDERLDRWRLALAVERAQHAERIEPLEAAVAAGWAWARARGTPEAVADAWNWEGLLLRRRLLFREAAAAHAHAAEGKSHVSGRLSARLNEADARLEHADLGGAERAAALVRDEAAPLRLAIYEGRATRILRAIRYRRGQPCPVDPDLVEAATMLGDMLAGELLFTEAASAWWYEDLPTATALAASAARRWAGRKERALPLLAASLAEATREDVNAEAVGALGQQVLATDNPGLQLQALGILVWAAPTLRDRWMPDLRALAARIPDDLGLGRRELFTVAEVLAGNLNRPCTPRHRTPAGAMKG